MTEQANAEAEEIRLTIERERRPLLEKAASLRGGQLSIALRERAKAYMTARISEGIELKKIARDLGLGIGTLKHGLRPRPGEAGRDRGAAARRSGEGPKSYGD